MSILTVTDEPSLASRIAYMIGGRLVKTAELDEKEKPVSYGMAGTLYKSSGGWIMLSVPNALVRGVFDTLTDAGVELPPSGGDEGGKLNAHISVIRPEEAERFGGADMVTERGQQFHYTISRLVTLEPEGWSEMDRVWILRVHSPELQALRRSYGLTSLPNDGKYEFHITCAVKKKGVLARNEKAKAKKEPEPAMAGSG